MLPSCDIAASPECFCCQVATSPFPWGVLGSQVATSQFLRSVCAAKLRPLRFHGVLVLPSCDLDLVVPLINKVTYTCRLRTLFAQVPPPRTPSPSIPTPPPHPSHPLPTPSVCTLTLPPLVSNQRGPSGREVLVTTAVVTRNLDLGGPALRQFLLSAAAVTRSATSLGLSGVEFLVTTAVMTRNSCPLGTSGFRFLVTTAVVTRNWNRLGLTAGQFLVIAVAVTRSVKWLRASSHHWRGD